MIPGKTNQIFICDFQVEKAKSCLYRIVLYLAIVSDTHHESSWQKIQILEQSKKKPEEAPESGYGPPHFIRQLNSVELIEGQPAHFEAQLEPINDPQLAITWYV